MTIENVRSGGAMFGIGTTELLIFMAVVLLLFGSARLPSLMRNLGKSANEFKRGMRESSDDIPEKIEHTPREKLEEASKE